MNRIEKRQYIRNIKSKKGLQKKSTKGVFGKLPQYIIDLREKRKNNQKLGTNVKNCQNMTVSDKKEVE